MTDRIIPQAGQEQLLTVEQREQVDEAYFAAYRARYPKVFDAMDYVAYIASGHDPVIICQRLYEYRKPILFIGTVMGLTSYLLFFLAWR